MSFKIFYILLYFRLSCVFSSKISINDDARKNTIADSRNERSLIGDISQHDVDVSNLELQRKKTILSGNPISGFDWQLNQYADDYEEKNFLDTIAQEVAGLHYIGSCGGSLQSQELGIIAYKEYTNYTNNENCTWSIEMPEATRVLFTLEQSGFETCCDYLTIFPIGDNKAVNGSPRELRDTKSSVIVPGSRAIVRFTSGRSTIGTGFRVRFQKIPDLSSSVEDSQCGGVVTGDAGILNYKLGRDYSNNEWCVWLLYSKASMSFTFYLIQEGFESWCDYLLVNTVDPETGLLQNGTKKINAQSPFQVVEASLVIITFYSNASNKGTGFSLQFSSRRSDVSPKYNYKLHHTTNINGTLKYPDDQINREGGSADERDTIYVIVSNAVTNEAVESTVIDWKGGVFQRINGSCLYDSLIIYEPVFSRERDANTHGKWLEKAQFPNLNETFCPDVITVPEKNRMFSLPVLSFIIIFKALSAHKNGSRTSFKFDFHINPFVCGGLLEPLESEFGVISYKEDIHYANDENCTWTIEVPGAKLISFNLEKSGLHSCCDNVSVMTSRSNSFDGDLALSAILIYKNSRASVLGPRAMVKFSSDAWINGKGFRLRYQKLTISNKSEGACGGILKPLEGEVGIISYKENENYEDNEYCVWLIEVPMAQRISFNLEKDGFKADFDYLFIVSTDALGASQGQSFKLTSATPTASVAGPRAVVRFSSDDSGKGSGFLLLFGSSEHKLLTQEAFVCGGLLEPLESEFGEISYKEDIHYANDENCTWTIEVPGAKLISFNLEKSGLHSCCDNVSVMTSRSNSFDGDLALSAILRYENSSASALGPRAMVIFSSDGTGRGTGFRLRYQKLDISNKSEGACGGIVKPLEGEVGKIRYKENEHYEDNEYCIWLIEVPLAQNISFNLEKDGFKADLDYLVVVSTDVLGVPRGQSFKLTSATPTASVAGPRAVVRFSSYDLGIGYGFRLLFGSSEHKLLTQKGELCGGNVETSGEEFGWITYKEDENYRNDESCLWRIEIPAAARIGFTLKKNGLQRCCDYVSVYSADASGAPAGPSLKLRSDNSTTVVMGPRAMVKFLSDQSKNGLGFRLYFQNMLDLDTTEAEEGKCGGVIVGKTGVLNYKRGKEYLNNEHCVWLLHSPNSTSITLNLLEHGFEERFDYLLVNKIDPKTGTICNNTLHLNGRNPPQIIKEPLVVIVFQSDESNRGFGFSLAFSSSGTNSNSDYDFNLLHISEPNGTIEFPSPIWGDSGTKNKIISIVAYSLNQGTEEESLFSVAMKLSWKHGVFKRANQHCEYDTVTIYSAPKISGWNLVSRFPTVNDTSNCPDIVTVMAKELHTSMYPTFLAVFKPVASDEIGREQDEATSFAFTYENGKPKIGIQSGGCGGVYVENSGVIRYKDDGNYANDEECIWLIHVPLAESISFELQSETSVGTSDYISVSSVKPFIGVDNEAIVVSSDNPTATVEGPVAVITFTSDSSVFRDGFRLHFRMEQRTTEADDQLFTYKLFHQNRRLQNEFAYHAKPNQIAIVAFSSGIRRAGRNQIDVTSFRPQVNESCSSDSLLVYDVYGRVDRTIVLTKNFTAVDSNVEETHIDGSTVVRRCTALVNSQLQTCINNETCHAPVGGSFRTKSSSFLAIYNSVNATSSSEYGGFELASKMI